MSDAGVSGELRAQPLPELLGALLRQRSTAVLRMVTPSGPAEVYFTDGLVVAVELPGNVNRLGELLAASGAIDGETMRRTLAAPRPPGLRYGRWLVESGLLAQEHLAAALRLQVRRRLHRLFFADDGQFAIEPGEHGRGEGPERALVDPRRPVLQGVRSAWSEARYGARLPSSRLRLLATPAEMAQYGLQPVELALLDSLSHTAQTVGELVTSSVGGPASTAAAVRPIAYALFATGALVAEKTHRGVPAVAAEPARAPVADRSGPVRAPVADRSGPVRAPAADRSGPVRAHAAERSGPAQAAGRPPGKPTSSPSINAPLPGPPPDVIARAIATKRGVVDDEDLFAVLGVSREATRVEIKAAYLEAARLYHPDRLAAAGLEFLRSDAERIFRRTSEAHSTLVDDARRAAYLEKLTAPPELSSEQAQAHQILSAEVALFEGDVALKRRDFATAIDRLREAVRLNPSEGEALALLAWSRVAAGLANLVEMRPDFELAVQRAPRCARAHYFLGMARKQGRETQAAINSFRKAVDLDPRLAEAASELRVLQLRATRELPTMARGSASILDRLRKK